MILKIYWIVATLMTILGAGLQLGKIIIQAERDKINPLLAFVVVLIAYGITIPMYYAAFRYIFNI